MKDLINTPATSSARPSRDANPRAVSVHIEARSMSKAKGTRAHDFRLGKIPDYVDTARTELNRVLMTLRPLPEIRRENAALRQIAGRQRAMKRDAAVITSGIITFGTEAAKMFGSLSASEQDAAFLDLAMTIAAELGTQLESLVIHLDETTIHAHFTLRGYTDKGLAVSAATKAGTTARLQDIAAEVMQRYHAGIERGHRKRDRLDAGADYAETLHRSVRELHQDLPLELEQMRAVRDETEAGIEALRREKVAHQSEIHALEASAAKTRGHLAKLTARAELAAKEEKRRQTYEARLEKKEAAIAAATAGLEERARTLAAAEADLAQRAGVVEAAESEAEAKAAAVAVAETAARAEAARLATLSEEVSQTEEMLAQARTELLKEARVVMDEKAEVETSLAAIHHVVAEIGAGTIRVTDGGKITMADPAPVQAAPKSLRARLLPPILRLVRKIDETEQRATWLETMMHRVRSLLGRPDLPPEIERDAQDITRDWEP
ncbi:plasmid recombination protein [Pseudooceanicola spongiae]|uniref:Plasmid recombination enzyme n=1 Tax=Pseudooceanicola spongiae TaxID=2613965 RepID=A0A7L9WL40_9RHOB|nr:plasmid recombination protein [Pseudooceanicola spongiae]QOL81115.1 hypothetical protein F3W81_10015 [Pseudooceanicola spongiae]